MSFRIVFALVDSEPKHWLIFRHFNVAVNTKTGEIAYNMGFFVICFRLMLQQSVNFPTLSYGRSGRVEKAFPIVFANWSTDGWISIDVFFRSSCATAYCAWSAKASSTLRAVMLCRKKAHGVHTALYPMKTSAREKRGQKNAWKRHISHEFAV